MNKVFAYPPNPAASMFEDEPEKILPTYPDGPCLYYSFHRSTAEAVAAMVQAKFEIATCFHMSTTGMWIVSLAQAQISWGLKNQIDTFVSTVSALLSRSY